MEDIKDGLRYLFQTNNHITFCVSCSGSGGIETALFNLVDDDDTVLFAVTGEFGKRAVEMGRRLGANVHVLEAEPGTILKYEQIRAHVDAHRPKIV